MSSDYVFVIEGLGDLENLVGTKAEIDSVAARAINKAVTYARKVSAEHIMDQVKFPPGYLTGADGQDRLKVIQRAQADRLEGIISGRRRATSLARFVTSTGKHGRRPTVEVHHGRAITLGRGFLMNLRKGQTGVLGNQGLAIRTSDGQKPKRAYKPRKIGNNLWLLYGPSVDQVFKTVRADVSDDVANYLESEFRKMLGV